MLFKAFVKSSDVKPQPFPSNLLICFNEQSNYSFLSCNSCSWSKKRQGRRVTFHRGPRSRCQIRPFDWLTNCTGKPGRDFAVTGLCTQTSDNLSICLCPVLFVCLISWSVSLFLWQFGVFLWGVFFFLFFFLSFLLFLLLLFSLVFRPDIIVLADWT